MLPLFLYVSLALYLTIFPNLPQVAQAQRLPPVKRAAQGETATGEVVKENGNQLDLNVRPCNTERIIVIFQTPYVKDPVGTIQCQGMTRALVQVIQR
jgi:hypothetical protein